LLLAASKHCPSQARPRRDMGHGAPLPLAPLQNSGHWSEDDSPNRRSIARAAACSRKHLRCLPRCLSGRWQQLQTANGALRRAGTKRHCATSFRGRAKYSLAVKQANLALSIMARTAAASNRRRNHQPSVDDSHREANASSGRQICQAS